MDSAQIPINLPINEQNKVIESIKPKNNYSVLPVILIILGLLETIWFSYYLITLILVIPKLGALYSNLNVKQTTSPYLAVLLVAMFVLIALAETFYGIWLNKLQKAQSGLPAKHKRIVKIIFALTILLFALWFVALVFSAVLPIYTLNSAF